MSLNGNLYVPLGGWGRNINHDPRSKAFKAARRATVTPKDVGHEIHIAPMDQGDLGSCVPHAGTAMLATDTFWDTLDAALKATLSDPDKAEAFAQQAYREVTRLDPYPGAWEPDDTGSDGLSLWKLWRQRGYVGGSEHVMSVDDAHALIQKTAYPIGISWLTGMDQPGTDGVVKVTGRSRGGHEVLVYAYDASRDLWWCRNSWGKGFGKGGNFAFDTPGYQRLMSLQADGTGMVPVTAPDPQPAPVDPTPAPVEDPFADWPAKVVNNFVKHRAVWWPKYQKDTADALAQFRKAHNLP